MLDLPLDRLDAVLQVTVPWLDTPLWFVPGEADVEGLVSEGVSRGAIWTARELSDLLAIGATREQARTVTRAKLAVDGDLAEVRPRRSSHG